VEWLEVEPYDGSAEPPLSRRGRPVNWPLLVWVTVAAVVVGVVAVRGHHAGAPGASAIRPPVSSASARATSAPASTAATLARPAPPIQITDVGHPLLGVSANWELFALGPDGIVRIQFALGRITRTSVPELMSSGPVWFVVAADRAIVRPLDYVTGYVVVDGKPARELSGALSHGGPALPGPDPAHVWVEAGGNENRVMALVGSDGRATGVSVRVPVNSYEPASADGAGYLLFNGLGGVYDARPDGIRRVTTGALVAVGRTRWLTMECDDQDRCSSVVIDRASGARHVLGGTPSFVNAGIGVISPDGSTAAFLSVNPADGASILRLLDLASGVDRALPRSITAGQAFSDGGLGWSPDSRWLFVARPNGHILAVDARTSHVQDVGTGLTQISLLAIRNR
jgi:hypothetical protein